MRSPIAKFLAPAELDGIRAATGAREGDAIFLAADAEAAVVRVLGALRPHLAELRDLYDRDAYAFAFVVDFPLFAWDEDEQRWAAEHHMFTAPKREHEQLLDSDPGAVVSEAYDFVCNGLEIASGSIRIHRADLQQKIFDIVGFSREAAEERFGFLLRALRYGAPPHGGIAPGLDRAVMLLERTENIRDVIAFPKIVGRRRSPHRRADAGRARAAERARAAAPAAPGRRGARRAPHGVDSPDVHGGDSPDARGRSPGRRDPAPHVRRRLHPVRDGLGARHGGCDARHLHGDGGGVRAGLDARSGQRLDHGRVRDAAGLDELTGRRATPRAAAWTGARSRSSA